MSDPRSFVSARPGVGNGIASRTPIEAARFWIERGFSPVPVPYQSKRPILNGWQQLQISCETAHEYFDGDAQNIGIHLGDRHGSADVDCDCPEAIAAARALLPETGLVFGRNSKPSSHFIYRADPKVRTIQFKDPIDHKTLVELRGQSVSGSVGLQTVVPPSVHPTGELIRFEEGYDGNPAKVDAEQLIRSVSRVAAVALLARHWPAQGGRHDAFLALAGILGRAKWTCDEVKSFHRTLYGCLWPNEGDFNAADSEVESTFDRIELRGDVTGVRTLTSLIERAVVDAALKWLGIGKAGPRFYGWNDTGNADRLNDLYGHELAFCPERNGYFVWTGKHWQFDGFVEVERRAEKAMLEAYSEAKLVENSDNRKEFVKFVNRSLSRAGLTNMVHLAKKKVKQVSPGAFDCNPNLLNTVSGTLDLRTGHLHAHRPEDLLSKMIPFRYDPQAKCPQFLKFLNRIMGGHPDASAAQDTDVREVISYLQLAFGCAATGKPEKVLFVLFGKKGNNGKTTLIEIIRDALGDKEYAGQVQVESLMARSKEALSSNAVNTDLADLQGCRFVSSSEVEEGQRLCLSRVKYLTGLGQLKARRMREDMITFSPTHKLFLDCNHKPVITDAHDAVWNRVKCIPFLVEIPDLEIDTDLPAKLRTELPGILNWIVEGATRYLKNGLGDPPVVIAAIEKYREESDKLNEFFANRYVFKPGERKAEVPTTALFQAYECWAEDSGQKHSLSKATFEDQLQKRGCTKGRDSSGTVRVWKGIRSATVLTI